MGNHISCSLSKPLGKHTRSAEVIFPGGEIRQIQTPIKAAELMLEKPNFFLINSQCLKLGRRFSPLKADEDLEPKNVYVMFSVKRATSKINATDMASLFLAANKAAKRSSSGKVKILPESAGEEVKSADDATVRVPKLDDMEEFSHPEFVHRRLSVSRSKKPLLETIAEEPVYARRLIGYV